jgi:hypothetical protein
MQTFNPLLAFGALGMILLGLIVLACELQVRSLTFCIAQVGFSRYLPGCRRVLRQHQVMVWCSRIITLVWLIWCIGWVESLVSFN